MSKHQWKVKVNVVNVVDRIVPFAFGLFKYILDEIYVSNIA